MPAFRVLIFEDDDAIRSILWGFFDGRGYEVFTFPHPGTCPLSEAPVCKCSLDEACSDIIVSDLNMPSKKGIDFLQEQMAKGCRCRHLALMSGEFLPEDIEKASNLGIKIFNKPFSLTDIENWLVDIERKIEPARKLSDWYIKKP
jgi:CheY-like chemotaxis protein